AATGEPFGRLPVEGFIVAQQRTAARFDAQCPLRAARLRAFAQAVQRGRGLARMPAVNAGLDQLRQGPSPGVDVLMLASLLRGSERLAVVAEPVMQQRGQP